MPFHIFLSQSLSLATGGLETWKVAKDVVLAILTVFTVCLVWQQRRGNKLFNWLVVLGALYGLLHFGVWVANPDIFGKSAILGLVYNTRLPCFLVLGYGAALLNPGKFVFSLVFKVVLGVSTVVALLGVLQYFLPKDLLTHAGYGLERGTRAAFFIDDNASLPRVMSTLREPNALGAYLLVPITALVALVGTHSRRLLLGSVLLMHLAALFLTFSRSAWLATAVSVLLVIVWQYGHWFVKIWEKSWPVLVIAVVAICAVGFLARDSSLVQHYVTHSTEEAVVDLDSNDYHQLFIEQALSGIANEPLGHGPGTAGLASIHNPAGGQLTENYYLQVAYEVGLIGLIVFLAINTVVYLRLWRRHDTLGAILLASFWGYVVTNMLLHTWSNEAVAAQWWLLAGIGMLPVLTQSSGKSASTKTHATS